VGLETKAKPLIQSWVWAVWTPERLGAQCRSAGRQSHWLALSLNSELVSPADPGWCHGKMHLCSLPPQRPAAQVAQAQGDDSTSSCSQGLCLSCHFSANGFSSGKLWAVWYWLCFFTV